jgi:hypothetical protein
MIRHLSIPVILVAITLSSAVVFGSPLRHKRRHRRPKLVVVHLHKVGGKGTYSLRVTPAVARKIYWRKGALVKVVP